MKIKNLLALALLLSTLPTKAVASTLTMDAISAPDGLTLNVGNASMRFPTSISGNPANDLIDTASSVNTLKNKTFDETSNVYKLARGTYDFAVSGGASNLNVSVTSLPANSIVKNAWVDFVTAPVTLAGDYVTVGVTEKSAGDIFAAAGATAIGVAIKQGVPANTVGTAIKNTGATSIKFVTAGGGLSAGKAVIFIEYLISQ